MNAFRIIPCLLLKDRGLVKGQGFADHKYVGDPINAVNIFNAKEVDELVFLDIRATADQRMVDLDLVQQLADECGMPFAVGGGITCLAQAKELMSAGAEKVVLNTSIFRSRQLIEEIAGTFGSQCVVASIDVKSNLWGKQRVYVRSGSEATRSLPAGLAAEYARSGAGEILITSIDRDGMRSGYDLELIKSVTSNVDVPVIACGGAGSLEHMRDACVVGGASAAAAGSLFVFHGPRRAVLINYPSRNELERLFASRF
jgi:cyclase